MFPTLFCDKNFGGKIDCVWNCIFESCSKYMYLNLNGSNGVKVILVCVILGSAHSVLNLGNHINFGFQLCDNQHLRL